MTKRKTESPDPTFDGNKVLAIFRRDLPLHTRLGQIAIEHPFATAAASIGAFLAAAGAAGLFS